MSTPKTLIQHATAWALGTAAGIVILLLNAYLDHKHPETETASLTAQVVSDRGAEYAAIHQHRATAVASKE